MRRILLLSTLALLIGQQASGQTSGQGLTVKSGSTVHCTQCKRTPKAKKPIVKYDPVKRKYVMTTVEVENNCIHRHNLQQKEIDGLKGRVTNLEERQDADDKKFIFLGDQGSDHELRIQNLEVRTEKTWFRRNAAWVIPVTAAVVGLATYGIVKACNKGSNNNPYVPPAPDPDPEPTNNNPPGNSNNNPL